MSKSDIRTHMMKHAFFKPKLAKYELQSLQKRKKLALKRKKQERQIERKAENNG